MNEKFQHIISKLPYQAPFLFVDELLEINQNGATGTFLFQKDAYFYAGHFKDHPVTPGVILTECMAQIGLVCYGLYLMKEASIEGIQIALSSYQIDFYTPVFPQEKVTVISTQEYFRFQKLKCNVKMINEKGVLVAKGTISGMMSARATK